MGDEMTYRGLLKFTDQNGDPAGEILLEELKRMPADWLDKAEDRGLTWTLGETPLCDSCLILSLSDEAFDPEFDACEKCKPLFMPPPVSETFCEYCKKPLPEDDPVRLTGWRKMPAMWCSQRCFRLWMVKDLLNKGLVKVYKLQRKRKRGRGCIGYILKRRLDRLEKT